MTDIYDFIFRGVLTEESLDKGGRKKISNFINIPCEFALILLCNSESGIFCYLFLFGKLLYFRP